MSNELKIPENKIPTFISLSKISDDAFKELFSEIAKCKSVDFTDGWASEFFQNFKLLPNEVAQDIVETVISLFPAVIYRNKSVTSFMEDLLTSLKPRPELNATDLETIKSRMSSLLRVPTLSIMAKATSVFYENERSYTNSRFVSELRPVFGLEDDSINGMVLIHTLKLVYFNDEGENKELYLSLDDADLDDLLLKIEREKTKMRKIKELLEASSIKLISLDDE